MSNRQYSDFVWLSEILSSPEEEPYAFRDTRVAIGAWPTDGLHWVATLGSRRIFLMVSDLAPERVGEFLSHIVHLDRREISLELGLSLKHKHRGLSSRGWEAVCFLDPEDIPDYPGPEIGHITDRMLWALPITGVEHEARNFGGVTAMFDCIDKSGRDVLRLRHHFLEALAEHERA